MVEQIQEIIKEIADLKALLLYYHGENIRKTQIDKHINSIENKVKAFN